MTTHTVSVLVVGAAMEATLAWLDATHGGAAGYLGSAGVSAARLETLRARDLPR